ncbi:MAG: T9SS type A sorting domain-containing protein [Rhodothermales bacterium]|nr:T9SS type A sorting domain-containing protein [Rhodothermales bacterium]
MNPVNRIVRSLCLCVTLSCVGAGMWGAQAQPLRSHAPDRVVAGGQAALYLEWEGFGRFEGGVLTLPAGWEPSEARLVQEGGLVLEPRLSRIRGQSGRFQILPPTARPGHQTLVVRIRAPGLPDFGEWEFMPYRAAERAPGSIDLEPDAGLRQRGTIASTDGARSENRALQFTARDQALLLDARRLPSLSAEHAFTVETWFRTSVADQVMLSTWTGDERDPYALEVVLDATGHAVFFQGQEGEHRSLRSQSPVADGGWHHLAVTHDPERNWSHLTIDGVQQDSLQHRTALQGRPPDALAVGGRVGSEEGGAYLGDIDELRIWGLARSPTMIRSTVYRTLRTPAAGAAFFSFDEGIPAALRLGRSGPRPRDSDLSFHRGLDEINVDLEDGAVSLSWAAFVAQGDRLLVERSHDGPHYEVVAGFDRQAGVPADGGQLRYFYRDDVRETVTFYRIRQQRAAGDDRVSNAIKVGRNEVEAPPRLAHLDGSFPNPFNPTTSIRYSLDEGQDVSVSVWDLSGQLVQTLWTGFQEAGEYTVSFSADDLPSGTYFVRLQSPEGIQSHPILLMK